MTGPAALLTGLGLVVAAPAAADTTGFGSWGNDTLGGSLGPNGFTSSVAGTTTSVDGINTRTGSFSVTNKALGVDIGGNAQYGTDGYVWEQNAHSTVGGFSYTAHSELGAGQVELEPTLITPNGSVSLVCDVTGCRLQ